jgi:hypothetical protein
MPPLTPKQKRLYHIKCSQMRINNFQHMLADTATGAPGGDMRQEVEAALKQERLILAKLQLEQ